MCPATAKRKALGYKPIAFSIPLDAWRRLKSAASGSTPPLSQTEFLRTLVARCEPIVGSVEPVQADQSGEAR